MTSGFEEAWTARPTRWDNDYFKKPWKDLVDIGSGESRAVRDPMPPSLIIQICQKPKISQDLADMKAVVKDLGSLMDGSRSAG